MAFNNTDRELMALAFAEAEAARGLTRPNPAVGAVVSHGGEVITRGRTSPVGGPHAEAAALSAAGERALGATLHVTLEPCNHHGRTPPCTEAIIRAGIRRVVLGQRDPNPLAAGGIDRLRAAGIAVDFAPVEDALRAARLNEAFNISHLRGRPLVTLKWALSADGCTSAPAGDARWITGPESRHRAHQLREEHDAVVVGIGTLLQDDARLTMRDVTVHSGPRRLRIVVDSHLRTPPSAALLAPDPSSTAVIACLESVSAEHLAALAMLPHPPEFWRLPPGQDGRVSIPALVARLHAERVQSVLVEGGRTLAGAFASQGLADRVAAFVAPVIIGSGTAALGAIAGRGSGDSMSVARTLLEPRWEPIPGSADCLLTGRLIAFPLPGEMGRLGAGEDTLAGRPTIPGRREA